ncbi:MAG TPA: hypothetical protein VG937_04830 [Polyangiaceae bacterium]|nr:hypothetical protein [Polyangiaceae bacterium]
MAAQDANQMTVPASSWRAAAEPRMSIGSVACCGAIPSSGYYRS